MIDEQTLYHFRSITLPVKTWSGYRGAEATGEAFGYIKEDTCDFTYEERYYFRHYSSYEDEWHQISLEDVRRAKPAGKADKMALTQKG